MFESLKEKKSIEKALTTSEPMSIFVGCTPAQDLVVKVLEYSIKKNTTSNFKIFKLHEHNIDFEMPIEKSNRPGTPFSFQRFMIPEICEFKGRALYIDSDQLITDDLAKLYFRDMKQQILFVKTEKQKKMMQRASVMLMNCEKIKISIHDIIKDLNSNKYTYKRLMTHMPFTQTKGSLPTKWNSLDRDTIGLIHYTDKETQPWLNTNHQDECASTWFNYLFQAIDEGCIDVSEVRQAIEAGFVRPSLAYQVENRITKLHDIPTDVKKLDFAFLEFCRKYKFNNVPGEYRDA